LNPEPVPAAPVHPLCAVMMDSEVSKRVLLLQERISQLEEHPTAASSTSGRGPPDHLPAAAAPTPGPATDHTQPPTAQPASLTLAQLAQTAQAAAITERDARAAAREAARRESVRIKRENASLRAELSGTALHDLDVSDIDTASTDSDRPSAAHLHALLNPAVPPPLTNPDTGVLQEFRIMFRAMSQRMGAIEGHFTRRPPPASAPEPDPRMLKDLRPTPPASTSTDDPELRHGGIPQSSALPGVSERPAAAGTSSTQDDFLAALMNGISNATNMSTTDKADQFDPATDEINTFLSDFEFSMQDVPRSQWMKPLRGR
jgi:hypothetical protein